ncbi:hypothetical protein PUV54_04430 [Hyphococcus flavus]|uniref:Uncharacterized protein n=1 Tax=Hyphococcus flavus TaxID=1866326 RepID=A0AAF0CC31_9PROT|nr:hypothetical protein [Hyphococcus flavus]WDI32440.1 hypothetical protein PUV54_04430 [Hyphococcus flavus]
MKPAHKQKLPKKEIRTFLVKAIPYVGLVTAVLAALLEALDLGGANTRPWSLGLMATSLSALWLNYIIENNEVKSMLGEFRKSNDDTSALMKAVNTKDVAITDRVMRAGFFGGSEFDDAFWLSYCESLRAREGGSSELDAVRDVVDALETQELRIMQSEAFSLMRRFCEITMQRGGTYFATTTPKDLDTACRGQVDNVARYFLFDFPTLYPKNVRRVFLLKSMDQLQDLEDQCKESLHRQLQLGVELLFLEIEDAKENNFGIYGDLAVGNYDEVNAVNIVSFDKRKRSQMMQRFIDLRDQSKVLTASVLN